MSMTAAEIIAVVSARRDGKRIEMRDANDNHRRNWVAATPSLMWDFLRWEYRIKPEPPKPREWWIVAPKAHLERYESASLYDCKQSIDCDSIQVHVREVLPDDGSAS